MKSTSSTDRTARPIAKRAHARTRRRARHAAKESVAHCVGVVRSDRWLRDPSICRGVSLFWRGGDEGNALALRARRARSHRIRSARLRDKGKGWPDQRLSFRRKTLHRCSETGIGRLCGVAPQDEDIRENYQLSKRPFFEARLRFGTSREIDVRRDP